MIDYEFTVDIYSRYHKHLESIESSINKNLAFYERSRIELERLVQFKPKEYQKALDDIQHKIKQADIKLSHIIPRMEKLRQQSLIISKEHKVEVPTFIDKDDAWTGK